MEQTIALTQRALRRRGLPTIAVSDRELAHWSDSGNFRISLLPGNTRVAISHAVWLPKNKRGQGLGKKLLRSRMAAFREAGLRLILATVRNSNRAEMHLLRRRGWKRLIKFGSTSLWGKVL